MVRYNPCYYIPSRVIAHSRYPNEWTINSFDPYKSTSPDGISKVELQKNKNMRGSALYYKRKLEHSTLDWKPTFLQQVLINWIGLTCASGHYRIRFTLYKEFTMLTFHGIDVKNTLQKNCWCLLGLDSGGATNSAV